MKKVSTQLSVSQASFLPNSKFLSTCDKILINDFWFNWLGSGPGGIGAGQDAEIDPNALKSLVG